MSMVYYRVQRILPFFWWMMMSQMFRLEQGSTPVVGSSRTTRREPPMNAMEIDSFRFMPPERLPTRLCRWLYSPVSCKILNEKTWQFMLQKLETSLSLITVFSTKTGYVQYSTWPWNKTLRPNAKHVANLLSYLSIIAGLTFENGVWSAFTIVPYPNYSPLLLIYYCFIFYELLIVLHTHLRTCSFSSSRVQCGALICPYNNRCSLVLKWSKRTSYCIQTPSSLRTSLMLPCISLPYTSIEPEEGPKRPVRRDLEPQTSIFYCKEHSFKFKQSNLNIQPRYTEDMRIFNCDYNCNQLENNI